MRTTIAYMSTLVCLCACAKTGSSGEQTADAPYQLGQALVIGENEGGQLVNVDESCDSAACAAVRERCGDQAYADVVVDQDGNVLDVLCFRGNAQVQEVGVDPVPEARLGNNSVLVLDDTADGADVTGDVVLTGNNATIYGQGADVSAIGGDLDIDKNNAIVRGVSIAGDVRIEKNNAQLSFTEIHGDLTIEGNNVTLAKCVVFGDVIVNGVNTVLVQNRFATARFISGKNLTCNGNRGFDAELGDAGAGDAAAADAGAVVSVECDDQRGGGGHR